MSSRRVASGTSEAERQGVGGAHGEWCLRPMKLNYERKGEHSLSGGGTRQVRIPSSCGALM